MFNREQSTESTICLSGHVHMYVSVRMPWVGRTLGDRYMDRPASVSSRRRISQRLLSNSRVVAMLVLQPTPLCHMAYVTLLAVRPPTPPCP